MKGEQVKLKRLWTIGSEIGSGGYGKVYEATADGGEFVAKFIPNEQRLDREMLFTDLPTSPYLMPILESGAFKEYWVLIMPRAQMSLKEHLEASGGSLPLPEVVRILIDVCNALMELEKEKIVHRDIKPANVLHLDGIWCLADFGISRYIDATTASDTKKDVMSPKYAAPERWRGDRATSATDVYSSGIMAFEMITGHLPFSGSAREDLRDQHLHSDPEHLADVPLAFSALIDACLLKPPEARPGPAILLNRLERIEQPPSSPALSALEEASHVEAQRQQQAMREQSEARSRYEQRKALSEAAQKVYVTISETLSKVIEEYAPAADVQRFNYGEFKIRLGMAEIWMSPVRDHIQGVWGSGPMPAFDVVLTGEIGVRYVSIPDPDRIQYEGRSHSLWYGDCQKEDQFGWYETAFMLTPGQRGRQVFTDPFALHAGEKAARALSTAIGIYQVAWPFTEIAVYDLDEFVERWVDWFVRAAQGKLSHPGKMPERPHRDTWRSR